MQKILDRIKEPSTWAGLGILASLFGVPGLHIEVVQQAVMAVAGAAAVFMSEKGGQ